MLTFIGIRPVQEPYVTIGQVSSILYFSYYPTHCFLERGWDILIGYIQFRFYTRGEISRNAEFGYDGGSDLLWNEL